MLTKERLGVTLLGVPAGRVPSAPALKVLPPHDWMIATHGCLAGVVTLLIKRCQDMHIAAWICSERVPLVQSLPLRGQHAGTGMRPVLNNDGRLLIDGWMPHKPRARQLAVPRPVVFGISGGVHSNPRATGMDVLLKRLLLRVVKHIACGGEEHNRAIILQIGGSKYGRVFGCIHGPTPSPKFRHCANAIGNGSVPEPGSATEDQNARKRCGGSDRCLCLGWGRNGGWRLHRLRARSGGKGNRDDCSNGRNAGNDSGASGGRSHRGVRMHRLHRIHAIP